MADDDAVKSYKKLEIIGRGAYGAVYKGQHKATGKVVALKILNLDTHSLEDDFDDIQREIALLSTLRDAELVNVVQYYGSHLYGSKLWIVMDYAQGGSIRTLMKASPGGKGRIEEEKFIAIIVRETLIALTYLHKNGIIHRDIKAANILLTKAGRVLLCDFGVAATLSVSQMKRNTFVGTPYWMSPEVIQTGALYDTKADCWSLGITVYEMACGNPPYVEVEPMRAITMIPTAVPPRLPEGPGHAWSKDMRDFVVAALNEVPGERASAEDLSKTRWIKSNQKLQTSLLSELILRYERWQREGGRRASLTDTYREKVTKGDEFDFEDEEGTARPDSEFFDFATVRPSASRTPSNGPPSGGEVSLEEGGSLHPLQQLFKSDQELETMANQVLPVPPMTPATPLASQGYSLERRPESPSKTMRPIMAPTTTGLHRALRPRADSKGATTSGTNLQVAPPMQRANTSQGFDGGLGVGTVAMTRSSSTGIDSPTPPASSPFGTAFSPMTRSRAMTRPGMPTALRLAPYTRTELPTIPSSATATSFPSTEVNDLSGRLGKGSGTAGLPTSVSAHQLSAYMMTPGTPSASGSTSTHKSLRLPDMPVFPPLDPDDKESRPGFHLLRTKPEVQSELSRQLNAVLSRLEVLENGFGLLLSA